MAKKKRPRGRYNWDKWFKSHHKVLKQGVDFHCSVDVMGDQIRLAAIRRHMRVSVSKMDDTIVMEKRTKRNDHLLPRERGEILEQILKVYPNFEVQA